MLVLTCYHGYRQISLFLQLQELLQFSVGNLFFFSLSDVKGRGDFDFVFMRISLYNVLSLRLGSVLPFPFTP